MSHLTEVTVIVSTAPAPHLDAALCGPAVDQNDARQQQLVRLDTGAAGGSKYYCSGIYAAMFNHITTATVIAFLDGIDWGGDTAVVVIDEENNPVEVIRYPRNGRSDA